MTPTTATADRLADRRAVKAARRNLIDPAEAERLAELLALLADPARAWILVPWVGRGAGVGDVAATLEVSEDAAGYGGAAYSRPRPSPQGATLGVLPAGRWFPPRDAAALPA